MKTTIVTLKVEKQLCSCTYILNTVLAHFSPVLLLYRNHCINLHIKFMNCFLHDSNNRLKWIVKCCFPGTLDVNHRANCPLKPQRLFKLQGLTFTMIPTHTLITLDHNDPMINFILSIINSILSMINSVLPFFNFGFFEWNFFKFSGKR